MSGLHGVQESGLSAAAGLQSFRRRLARSLFAWFAPSCLAGGALLLQGEPLLRTLGAALAAWGVAGAAIGAAAGGASRRLSAAGEQEDPLRPAQETRRLQRLLRAGMAAGVAGAAAGLLIALQPEAGPWRGAGWGTLAQSLLLIALGVVHLGRVPPLALLPYLPVFDQPEHQPFLLGGGERAALLVHGFAGSPADMRPLAEVLNAAGWSVRGMLLPGFGPQLSALPQVRWQDWIQAVTGELQLLRALYHGVLLVGFSLGGAICLAAAAEENPDGLVLLAPFTSTGGDLKRTFGGLVLPYVSRFFYPLKGADFSSPRLRKAIGEALPEADLEDSRTVSTLRSVGVPSTILKQLVRAGLRGRRAAASVTAPALILQGGDDAVVRPEGTRRLLRRFRPPVRYEEVPGDHSLIRPSSPAWEQVAREVVSFAGQLHASEVPHGHS